MTLCCVGGGGGGGAFVLKLVENVSRMGPPLTYQLIISFKNTRNILKFNIKYSKLTA